MRKRTQITLAINPKADVDDSGAYEESVSALYVQIKSELWFKIMHSMFDYYTATRFL